MCVCVRERETETETETEKEKDRQRERRLGLLWSSETLVTKPYLLIFLKLLSKWEPIRKPSIQIYEYLVSIFISERKPPIIYLILRYTP